MLWQLNSAYPSPTIRPSPYLGSHTALRGFVAHLYRGISDYIKRSPVPDERDGPVQILQVVIHDRASGGHLRFHRMKGEDRSIGIGFDRGQALPERVAQQLRSVRSAQSRRLFLNALDQLPFSGHGRMGASEQGGFG